MGPFLHCMWNLLDREKTCTGKWILTHENHQEVLPEQIL